MKKLAIFTVAAALAAGVFLSTRSSQGQAARDDAPVAHQIGLIDMAYVFKNYEKFKAQTEALQAEIKNADDQAKAKIEAMKQVQERMGSLQKGSPDYSKAESQIIGMQTELETFRKTSQLDFLRREAAIYKAVYLEVQDAVGKYAVAFHYTLIMRFNRAGLDEAENPQDIIQSMNRQVVYFRNHDDCTDPILKYLNESYAKTSSGASSRPAPPRTATDPNRPRAN